MLLASSLCGQTSKDTVNYKDSLGRKQGKWLYLEEIGKTSSKNDSEYFIGFYINNQLKTGTFKFYQNKMLVLENVQTDFFCYRENSFYENGNLHSCLVIMDSANFVHHFYYPNNQLESVKIKTDSFEEWSTYFLNGGLQSIKSKLVDKEFYSNGMLKKETLINNTTKHTMIKYYYDNGLILAIKTIKPRVGETKIKWKCYDKKGNRVPRDILMKKGFKLLE